MSASELYGPVDEQCATLMQNWAMGLINAGCDENDPYIRELLILYGDPRKRQTPKRKRRKKKRGRKR